MAKAKKKKYSASDKAILGIGYVLLGAFVLSILVPLLYVVIASFMDPNGATLRITIALFPSCAERPL